MYLECAIMKVPLVMSPVMQATGWQIVHTWVWLHLMLTFAYSGEPLPTHCSTKFTTVLRGSDGVGVLRHDSMGIFASSPPGGVTPHSARKAQKMPASDFIRAEGSSNGSWGSRRALQPTCRSRRALEPFHSCSLLS